MLTIVALTVDDDALAFEDDLGNDLCVPCL